MKKEIVIVSDLWGAEQSEWVDQFESALSETHTIKFYDSCELGEINIDRYEEKDIHRQFVEFGIEQAANKLFSLEKETKMFIGCSVGGVIAWKAGMLGMPIEQLIAISSTRLRKETYRPDFPITLYYGQADQFKPGPLWIENMGKDQVHILNGGHEIYKETEVVSMILKGVNEKRN